MPAELDAEVLAAGWVHPWVLRHVWHLPCPVPAGQKPGQMIWVPLEGSTLAAIEAQMGEIVRTAAPETARPLRAKASAAPMRTPPVALKASLPATGNADAVMARLTEGAIRNGNLSVRNALHMLPDGVVGGSSRAEPAPRQLTVVFHPGETVETDVAGDKKLLRCRGAVTDFYARSGAKRGDLVHICRDQSDVVHVRIWGR